MGRTVERWSAESAELQRAVRAHCEAQWKKLAGRQLTDRDKADFFDRVLAVDEQRAQSLALELADVLDRVMSFYKTVKKDEAPSPSSRWFTSDLERFLTPITDRAFTLSEGNPAINLLRAQGRLPPETALNMYGRIFTLLSDRIYWRRFGLTEKPTIQTMAILSILLGCFPDLGSVRRGEKLSVAEVMRRQNNTLRAYKSRLV